MEELWELRRYIETGDYEAALALLDELEAMSKDDKITRIQSFMIVLLTHLIKQAVEERTTKSWDLSICNAADAITRINKRRKAGGWYLTTPELQEALEEVYAEALRSAATEAFEGIYSPEQLASMHDRDAVLSRTWEFLP